jgi:hypothetical protein
MTQAPIANGCGQFSLVYLLGVVTVLALAMIPVLTDNAKFDLTVVAISVTLASTG